MKWICDIRGCFPKFSILFALPSKGAVGVANVLSIHMMILGVPAILQTDNGKQFKGAVLQLVKNHGVKVRNGRARTTHVQGMY